MPRYRAPVHLATLHEVGCFDCASAELSDWLTNHALASHRGGHSRVAVVTVEGSSEVVAYYAIAPGSLLARNATSRLRAGGDAHPVPVVVLARLAVHSDHGGRGLGRALLLDAIVRALAAAREIGGRALLVHCKDERAREFYLHAVPEFTPLPGDPLTLVLMLKDARATLGIKAD